MFYWKYASVAGLTYRETGHRGLFARKQHLFMLALAQWICIQRLSPKLSGVLSYIPSFIFFFSLWSLYPPYKVTYIL